ncbi:hypothetical protein D3C86_1124000 [compost metagenome]
MNMDAVYQMTSYIMGVERSSIPFFPEICPLFSRPTSITNKNLTNFVNASVIH